MLLKNMFLIIEKAFFFLVFTIDTTIIAFTGLCSLQHKQKMSMNTSTQEMETIQRLGYRVTVARSASP